MTNNRNWGVHIISALSVHTIVQVWAGKWNWVYRLLDEGGGGGGGGGSSSLVVVVVVVVV